MNSEKFPSINVFNVIRGFRDPKLKHHITPFRFQLPGGAEHRIAEIRQTHRERAGKGFHYHFVVKTKEMRYFHIIFDSLTLTWKLVQEIDEELFFNE